MSLLSIRHIEVNYRDYTYLFASLYMDNIINSCSSNSAICFCPAILLGYITLYDYTCFYDLSVSSLNFSCICMYVTL